MEIKNTSVVMDTSILAVEGRCRLVGVQIGIGDPSRLQSKGVAQAMDDCTIVLTDGSSGGDTLFKVGIQGSGAEAYGVGVNPMSFMLGDRRILFESGIYVNQMGSSSGSATKLDRDLVYLSIFYEGA